MFNVLPALPGFRSRLSQEILGITKLMTANCSAESPTQHMRRICSMAHISNTCNIHCGNKPFTKSAFEDVWSPWFVVKTMTVDVFDTLTFVLAR